jgi:2-iminobutanoate/2-iminopropanoate deaminase
MPKKVIATDRAPAAVGAYSQATVAGGWVFCSGQIGLDPRTGALVDGGVVAEAEQIMKNLGAVLAAAGGSFEDVVKCSIFLADMGDFGAVDEVYAAAFEGMEPPARACVAVKTLPKNVQVEIEAIAYLGEGG